MPRFYFHLDQSSGASKDNAGHECVNVQEAIEFAEEIASELRERNPPERIFQREIVICDQAGNVVKRVPVLPSPGGLQ
jgi:hypothetical protein